MPPPTHPPTHHLWAADADLGISLCGIVKKNVGAIVGLCSQQGASGHVGSHMCPRHLTQQCAGHNSATPDLISGALSESAWVAAAASASLDDPIINTPEHIRRRLCPPDAGGQR